jgi:hypothetical protein
MNLSAEMFVLYRKNKYFDFSGTNMTENRNQAQTKFDKSFGQNVDLKIISAITFLIRKRYFQLDC